MNYADILDRERPRHEDDDFSRRHPKMPLEERAKIFMPFAALKGFGDMVARRSVVLENAGEASDDQMLEMDRTLKELQRQLDDGRPVTVSVRFFQPMDRDGRGQMQEAEGRLIRIDGLQGLLVLEDRSIPLKLVREVKQV